MVRRVLVLFAVAALSTHLLAGEVSPVSIKWEKNLHRGQATMTSTVRPMLLFVTAPGCTYCEQMKAHTFKHLEIAKHLNEKYVPVQINGRIHVELVRRLGVRMYPTTAIVHPSGRVVEIFQGYKKPAEFQNHLVIAKAKLEIENKLTATKGSAAKMK